MKKIIELLSVLSVFFLFTLPAYAEEPFVQSESVFDLQQLAQDLGEEGVQKSGATNLQQALETAKLKTEEISVMDSGLLSDSYPLTIEFDSEDYEGMTAEDVAKAKLQAIGFTEDAIYGMSDHVIEMLAAAPSVSVSFSYAKEVETESGYELREASAEDFDPSKFDPLCPDAAKVYSDGAEPQNAPQALTKVLSE